MTTAAAEARRAARDDIRHEHDALYVAKYATKAKPADHTTGCAPPAADAAAEAAAASGGGRLRCFTMDKESPFAAHAAAAGAVAVPLGVPGNKRVECDGGLYVRWDHTAKCVTKPVAPAAPCNTATTSRRSRSATRTTSDSTSSCRAPNGDSGSRSAGGG